MAVVGGCCYHDFHDTSFFITLLFFFASTYTQVVPINLSVFGWMILWLDVWGNMGICMGFAAGSCFDVYAKEGVEPELSPPIKFLGERVSYNTFNISRRQSEDMSVGQTWYLQAGSKVDGTEMADRKPLLFRYRQKLTSRLLIMPKIENEVAGACEVLQLWRHRRKDKGRVYRTAQCFICWNSVGSPPHTRQICSTFALKPALRNSGISGGFSHDDQGCAVDMNIGPGRDLS